MTHPVYMTQMRAPVAKLLQSRYCGMRAVRWGLSLFKTGESLCGRKSQWSLSLAHCWQGAVIRAWNNLCQALQLAQPVQLLLAVTLQQVQSLVAQLVARVRKPAPVSDLNKKSNTGLGVAFLRDAFFMPARTGG